jgi:mRNA-degrading endonuclease RelE of RelBE toxin-antitoxin system
MADDIEKLFRKISRHDRTMILDIIEKLISGDKKELNIVKVKNTDFYRVKKGNFRILYHFEKKEVVIDSIKLRNEKTYK